MPDPVAAGPAIVGRRSGVPHTDAEIEALGDDALKAEIRRVRVRLSLPNGSLLTKAFQKTLHRLEKEQGRRTEA